MKESRIFFLLFIVLGMFSCSKSHNIEDCARIENLKILSDSEKEEACIYNNVYRYNSEIYTVCECCVCDKISFIIDCEGEQFCEENNECRSSFFLNAEYLFSVK